MVMNDAEKRLVEWLRDAHAMEQQAEKMMETQASRIQNYPEVVQQLERHIEETKRQTKKVESCLARYDESASGLKDVASKMTALGQTFSGMFTGDEVVKGCLAWTTFEHFEIASYRILIAAAEEVGDHETKRICEEILKEEEAMAAWLEQNTPHVVRQYLQRDQAGADAKR
jgi:ferritin-like metal-binding protein YciE